jgi:hypothetical protein
MQEGTMEFCLVSIWDFFSFDSSSPLWKRGDRGDFPELAIDRIIFFTASPFFKGGISP